MTQMRLNKFLSAAGIASRRKSEEYIEQGRVSVNGKVVDSFAINIDTDNDEVMVDGELIKQEKKTYILLNKPKGTITTTEDERHRKTVMELIKTEKAVFPVGRLDFNTTGVLLLTNDGDFANFLTHPKNKIIRSYVAKLDKPLTKEHREKLEKGLYLDRRKSFFRNITFPIKNNYRLVSVDVIEGRNHFVKRMFQSLGYFVMSLERTNFGGLQLKDLKPGEYRKLSYGEIQKIVKINE